MSEQAREPTHGQWCRTWYQEPCTCGLAALEQKAANWDSQVAYGKVVVGPQNYAALRKHWEAWAAGEHRFTPSLMNRIPELLDALDAARADLDDADGTVIPAWRRENMRLRAENARLLGIERELEADAARYRKIKAAMEAKKDVNFTGIINERCDGIGHDGQIEIGFYGMDEAGDVYASGATLDAAVDAMPEAQARDGEATP